MFAFSLFISFNNIQLIKDKNCLQKLFQTFAFANLLFNLSFSDLPLGVLVSSGGAGGSGSGSSAGGSSGASSVGKAWTWNYKNFQSLTAQGKNWCLQYNFKLITTGWYLCWEKVINKKSTFCVLL